MGTTICGYILILSEMLRTETGYLVFRDEQVASQKSGGGGAGGGVRSLKNVCVSQTCMYSGE